MTHHCHARGCTEPLRPELLMCSKHWKMVPMDLKKLVWANYRPGQSDDKNPSPRYVEAAKAAIEAVALREVERG